MHLRDRQLGEGPSIRRAVLGMRFAGRTCSRRRPVFWDECGPPLQFPGAGIRARFGTQIPGTECNLWVWVLFALLRGDGIWAPFRARNLGRKMRPDSAQRHPKIKASRAGMVRLWHHPSPTRKAEAKPQHGRDFGLSMSRGNQHD